MVAQELSRHQREYLLRSARPSMERGYAPHSRFKVGAALLCSEGKTSAGCNLENLSCGFSNCAERPAIFSAVREGRPGLTICAIAVVNGQPVPGSPCGACRKVIYEFGPEASVVFLAANEGQETAVAGLLPEGFRLQ